MLSALLASSILALASAEAVPLNPSVSITDDQHSVQFHVENMFPYPVRCGSIAVQAHFVRFDGSALATINFQVLNKGFFPGEDNFFSPDANALAQQLLATNPTARIKDITDPASNCVRWDSITLTKPFWMKEPTYKVMKRYATHEAIIESMTPQSVMFNCDTRVTSDQCPAIKKRAFDKSCVTEEFNDYLRSVPNFAEHGVVPYCNDYVDPVTKEKFPYVEYFCPCDNPT